MRYIVPQFIDVKDKFFGPFTVTEGLYIVGGFMGSFAIFYGLGKAFPDMPWMIKLVSSSPVFGFGLALAKLKVNGRPFIKYLESLFFYLISPKKYNWKRTNKPKENLDIITELNQESLKQNIQESLLQRDKKTRKIKDLAIRLDMDLD